jgi:hypothetical protein
MGSVSSGLIADFFHFYLDVEVCVLCKDYYIIFIWIFFIFIWINFLSNAIHPEISNFLYSKCYDLNIIFGLAIHLQ